jgi:BirA family biotin operon repressor/biotin-[acetyl-CoA-carboxylase] ligase
MGLQYTILEILADGEFHSGKHMGDSLGVSRTAIWKHINTLGEMGFDIYSVQGKGYRLVSPYDPFTTDKVKSEMDENTRQLLSHIEILPEVGSTNRYLMDSAINGTASGHVCLAEMQTEGRGRRGRRWYSPFGQNIYLSLLWRFDSPPANLGSLSLAIAVAVARTLEEVGVPDVGVKWPNDLLWNGRKLAGILLEMTGESAGPCTVVSGVGVNVRMHKFADQAIDQPWIDLEKIVGGQVCRNRLAGLLIHHMLMVLEEFTRDGLEKLLEEWRRLDVFAGKQVDLHMHDRTVTGKAVGINGQGAFLLEKDGQTHTFQSGEISLRLVN